MLIVEDINYSIEDVIKSINEELGFSYIESTENSGYINLGRGTKLELEFNEDRHKLASAVLIFPYKAINIMKNSALCDIYATAIESADQIVDLINRMFGGKTNEEDID